MDPTLYVLGAMLAAAAVGAAVIILRGHREARLDEERRTLAGIDGHAVVVELAEEKPPFGEPVTEWFLTLDVTLTDGERFQLRKYWSSVGARTPAVGDALTVRAHPDRRRDITLVSVPFDS
jgi:hypothetical protein